MKIEVSLHRLVPAVHPFVTALALVASLAFATPASAIPPVSTTLDTATTTTTFDTATTTTDTVTTTLVVKGACCAGAGCYYDTESYCTSELQGTYVGDATSCDDPGICMNCGDGCKQYGETCDDGDTDNGDGCDSKCQEEPCFKCYVARGDERNVQPFCFGPSTCVADEKCGYCGDGTTGAGEQCDDGDTVSDDCCDASCQAVQAGTDCADGIFCDGAETCDGSGSCVAPVGGADCSALDAECVVGVCDPKLDACVPDSDAKNGEACENTGSCTVDGSGECEDGQCVGDGTTLSPSCRWIVCAGEGSEDVRVRTGDGSAMNANACGDSARWAGTTTASIIVGSTTGEGVYFYGPPEVDGDIATGGSTVDASLYITIPGTDQKTIATGQTVVKDPAGEVNTTGAHALIDVCNDDQAALAAAVPVLAAMGDPDIEEGSGNGLRIKVGESHTIDVTGQGLVVVDTEGLRVGKNGTLTLKGSASDVLLLRVNGPLKLGYGSQLILDGLTAANVAIYSDGPRCRLSPGAVGEGTLFCPEAGRFVVGAGVNWSGTFLGGARELQIRSNAALTHVPFTGF